MGCMCSLLRWNFHPIINLYFKSRSQSMKLLLAASDMVVSQSSISILWGILLYTNVTKKKEININPTLQQCKEILISFRGKENYNLDFVVNLSSIDLRTQVKHWIPKKPWNHLCLVSRKISVLQNLLFWCLGNCLDRTNSLNKLKWAIRITK